MVSPINRYPCGVQFGGDITQTQCESIAYCCFNPIDDEQDVDDSLAQELMDDVLGRVETYL